MSPPRGVPWWGPLPPDVPRREILDMPLLALPRARASDPTFESWRQPCPVRGGREEVPLCEEGGRRFPYGRREGGWGRRKEEGRRLPCARRKRREEVLLCEEKGGGREEEGTRFPCARRREGEGRRFSCARRREEVPL